MAEVVNHQGPHAYRDPVFIACNGFDLRALGFAEAVLSHHARRQVPNAVRVAVHSVFHGLVHGLQLNFDVKGKRHTIILSARGTGLLVSPVPTPEGIVFDVVEDSLAALRLLGPVCEIGMDGRPGPERAVEPVTLCELVADRIMPASFLMAIMATPQDFPFDPDLPTDAIVGMDADVVATFQDRLVGETQAIGSPADRQEMINLVKADFFAACRKIAGGNATPQP